MTERDQAALEVARAKVAELFPESQVLPTEALAREKEQSRLRDQDRIAQGEATPDQIQAENSLFTTDQAKSITILNLEDALTKMD
jgi:hypothetical protein